MRELAIHHIPATDDTPARVRVSYRAEPSAQPQEREVDFNFALTEEQHRLIQQYLEEYLLYPWDEFVNRAKGVEALMSQLGERLFEAIFSSKETSRLVAHIADHLPDTRIVIHASDPAGIALPWELMRDPTLGEYGDLERSPVNLGAGILVLEEFLASARRQPVTAPLRNF